MLNITEDFFKEEIRCDFTVPELMKRTWAAEMKVLSQLQDFFKEYGLTYYAEVGTLLGAVRHKGFVPWDDDIDICMKRADYMRFLELSDKLPYPLRAKNIYSIDTFKNFHTEVSNSRKEKLDYDEERMQMYYGCPFIVSVDIFPFDYIPRDENTRNMQKLLYNIAYVLVDRYDSEHDTPKFEQDVEVLEQYAGGKFDRSRPLLPQLTRLADRIAAMCGEDDADLIDYYPKMVHDENPSLHDKRCYDSTVMLPFECMEVCAPVLYEQAAREIYGDYSIFVKGASAHDYPFYKGQLEYFVTMGYMDGDLLK